jgi:hypothetical protein
VLRGIAAPCSVFTLQVRERFVADASTICRAI